MRSLKIDLLRFAYVVVITSIIGSLFYAVFRSYTVGIVIGLSIGFLTENKLFNN